LMCKNAAEEGVKMLYISDSNEIILNYSILRSSYFSITKSSYEIDVNEIDWPS